MGKILSLAEELLAFRLLRCMELVGQTSPLFVYQACCEDETSGIAIG